MDPRLRRAIERAFKRWTEWRQTHPQQEDHRFWVRVPDRILPELRRIVEEEEQIAVEMGRADLRCGTRIAGYYLTRPLGVGGFSEVWQARDESSGHDVALKVLLPAKQIQDEAVHRFRREAQISMGLEHPGIVRVLASDEQDGVHFIAQELVSGGTTLVDLIERWHGDGREARMDPEHTAELFVAICDGLAFAHERGVTHRDVKPSNILLTEEGLPKLADFGLAGMEYGSALTRSHQVLGTDGYMAPEQARGASRADPRSDVFSVGVTLFEVLAGRRAADSDDLPGADDLPDVPRDLLLVCRQAMEFDPARRYASCQAMGADLRRFLAGKSLRARGAGRWPAVVNACRSRPGAASAAALVTLAVVAWVSVWAPWQPSRAAGPNGPGGSDDGRQESRAASDTDDRAAYEALKVRRDAIPGMADAKDRVSGLRELLDDLEAFPATYPGSSLVTSGQEGRVGIIETDAVKSEFDRACRDVALQQAEAGQLDAASAAAADIGEPGFREQVQQEIVARHARVERRQDIDAARRALDGGDPREVARALSPWLRRELDALGPEALALEERIAAVRVLGRMSPEPQLIDGLTAELAAGLESLGPGDGLSSNQQLLVRVLCELGSGSDVQSLLADGTPTDARVDGLLAIAKHRESSCEDHHDLTVTITDLSSGLPIAQRLEVRDAVALLHARAGRVSEADAVLLKLGSRGAGGGHTAPQDFAIEQALALASLAEGDLLAALDRVWPTAEGPVGADLLALSMSVEECGQPELATLLLGAIRDDGLRSWGTLSLGLLETSTQADQLSVAGSWLEARGELADWPGDLERITRAALAALLRASPRVLIDQVIAGASGSEAPVAISLKEACAVLVDARDAGFDVKPALQRLLEPSALAEVVPGDPAGAAHAYACLAAAARGVLPGDAAECMRWALDELEKVDDGSIWLARVGELDPTLLGEAGARRLVVSLRGRREEGAWDGVDARNWRAALDVLAQAGGAVVWGSLDEAPSALRSALPAALVRAGAIPVALTVLEQDPDRGRAWRAAREAVQVLTSDPADRGCQRPVRLGEIDLSADLPILRELLALTPLLGAVLASGSSASERVQRLKTYQSAHDRLLAEHPGSLATRAHGSGMALCPHPTDDHWALAARAALEVGEGSFAALWAAEIEDGELAEEVGAAVADYQAFSPWADATVEERAPWLAARDPSADDSLTSGPVRRALDWLARHQHPDGYWDPEAFDRQCGNDPCSGHGRARNDVGVTSLALLAFLAGGHTDRAGDYQDVVMAGLEFLLDVQNADSGLLADLANNTAIYDHVLATLALTEVAGLTGDRQLRRFAQRGLDLITAQHKKGTGWRYFGTPRTNAGYSDGHPIDTSVTTWCVQALTVAGSCGFEVPLGPLSDAAQYLDDKTDDSGRTGYVDRGGASARPPGLEDLWPSEHTESMTAASLLARAFLDPGLSRPLARQRFDSGLNLLETLPIVWKPTELPAHIDYYYWHRATLVMFQAGGSHWSRWQQGLRELIKGQRTGGHADGSWDPELGPWGREGGRVYATAINALTLQAGTSYTRILD